MARKVFSSRVDWWIRLLLGLVIVGEFILSLDRLRIHYGKRRQIMISPADKAGFLGAIGKAPPPD